MDRQAPNVPIAYRSAKRTVYSAMARSYAAGASFAGGSILFSAPDERLLGAGLIGLGVFGIQRAKIRLASIFAPIPGISKSTPDIISLWQATYDSALFSGVSGAFSILSLNNCAGKNPTSALITGALVLVSGGVSLKRSSNIPDVVSVAAGDPTLKFDRGR